jgi:hypothetical protein
MTMNQGPRIVSPTQKTRIPLQAKGPVVKTEKHGREQRGTARAESGASSDAAPLCVSAIWQIFSVWLESNMLDMETVPDQLEECSAVADGGVSVEPGRALSTGVVTFLLFDVAGSTRLWESDPDAMGRAIACHYELLDAAIVRHGGARPIEQGESVVSAFASPSAAVAAALDAQRSVAAEPWPPGCELRIRVALHTGETWPSDRLLCRADGDPVRARAPPGHRRACHGPCAP